MQRQIQYRKKMTLNSVSSKHLRNKMTKMCRYVSGSSVANWSVTLVALVVVILCIFSTVRFLKTSAQDDDDVLLCIWAERDKLVSQWLGRLFLNCCEASHKRLSSLSSTSNYETYLLRRTLYLSELQDVLVQITTYKIARMTKDV